VTSKDDFDKASLRKQIDHDDLQREIAGLDAGRMRRFLPQTVSEQEKRDRQRKAEEAHLTALQVLLLNPAYANLYAETKGLIGQAKAAIDKARERLLEELSEVEAQLMEFRANASKLPDGTLILIGKDGEYVDEHGNTLDEAQRASVMRSDTMPSWSGYAEAKERQQALNGELEGVDDYERDVIIPGTARIEDEDNSLSLDELEDLNREIQSGMPKSVRVEILRGRETGKQAEISGPEKSVVAEYGLDESEFEKREIASSFDKARLEIPELDKVRQDGSVIPEIDVKPI